MPHNHPGDCFEGSRDCWLEDNSDAHREHFLLWRKGHVPRNESGYRVSLPCVFRGRHVHPPAAPDGLKTYWQCENGFGVVCECQQCNSACRGYSLADRLRVFDSANCWPEVPGSRFNASLVRWQGRTLLAFRNRQWDSQIWIGELDNEFRPMGRARQLKPDARECRNGCDDPRFFVHNGALHVALVGVERLSAGATCSMGFCQLSERLDIISTVFPQYSGRNPMEKNWGFFSADGRLYAVYSIAPHRILEINGDRASTAFLTPTKAEWHGGELRGGASPILADGRFYGFLHSSVSEGGKLIYNVGVYTFESTPPFRVIGVTPRPIMWADQVEPGMAKAVVFPCGAVFEAGIVDRWIVSGGRHDRQAELWEFDHADISRSIMSVTDCRHGNESVNTLDCGVESINLAMSIDGWSTHEKLAYIARKWRELGPLLAVEIGVWKGRVLALLGMLSQRHARLRQQKALVVGIDPYSRRRQVEGCADPKHVEWSHGVDWDAAHREALENLQRLCPDAAVLMRTDSATGLQLIPNRIDLAHVDGNHSTEQALADVRGVLERMSATGILILDDIDWESVKPAHQYLVERCELVDGAATWSAFRRI